MRKLFYKKWVKLLTAILCIVSFNVTIVSFALLIGGEAGGIYEKEKSDVLDEVYKKISMNYSVKAMTEYQNDFYMENLKNTHFKYGVIQTDDIEKADINNPSVYEVCNFDLKKIGKLKKEDLYLYSCNMGELTSYRVSDNLFGNYCIYNNGQYEESRQPILDCYYVRDTEKIFYHTDEGFYSERSDSEFRDYDKIQGLADKIEGESELPAEENSDSVETAEIEEAEEANTAYESGGSIYTYHWKTPNERIEIGDMNYYLSDIKIITQRDFEEMAQGERVFYEADKDNYYAKDGYIYERGEYTYNAKPYYVYSYVENPITLPGNGSIVSVINEWKDLDFYQQATALVDFVYSIRYGAYAGFIVGLILFLFSFWGVCTGAGHRNSAAVTAHGTEKMPIDLLAVVTGAVVFFLYLTAAWSIEVGKIRLILLFGGISVAVTELGLYMLLNAFAVRVKIGKWWRTTLLYIVGRKICIACYKVLKKIFSVCKRFLKKFIAGFRDVTQKINESLPILIKAWVVMLALALIEFIGILATSYNPAAEMVLWLLEKIILYAAFTVLILQIRTLWRKTEQMAKGDMGKPIDTTTLLPVFRKNGENLNHISDGIHTAVAEQMKSERFKTELITNVSHDIKTPLTSIINYVDLLGKEEINNPKVQEYLEVLSRQSGRLKKLIEDLMEASKASTGNLAVTLESCNAGVMLTQTIGEFEEKLAVNNIELIVQGSKENVYILADSRHLWRIFENLMNNICKYAQPSTRAYVNIEENGKIIFRNISRYQLNIGSEELMERFVRGDSSRNTEGSGLGISIAKSLTELMNGTFELIVDGDLFKVVLTFPLTETELFSEKM